VETDTGIRDQLYPRGALPSVSPTITEETPFAPVNVQSVHKAAAEQHYRFAAARTGIPIVSLRFGNTFGLNQPFADDDIGLVGGFIRALLGSETIEVFPGDRRRNLIFATDLGQLMVRLAEQNIAGFEPYNVCGEDLLVVEIARLLIGIAGTGRIVMTTPPDSVASIEVGNARLDGSKLEQLIGPLPKTSLPIALAATFDDVKRCRGLVT
jgi:UDP-glucose 4-epimerase